MIFPRVLVYKWEAGRSWTMGGRLMSTCVNFKVIVKVCKIWMHMVEGHDF